MTDNEDNFDKEIESKVEELISNIEESIENEKLGDILPVDKVLPNKLSIVPLQERPIFPGIFTPLMINNPEDIRLIEQAYGADGYIGLVMLKNDVEHSLATDLNSVGTAAKIIKKINLPDGGLHVFVSTIKRFKIRKIYS
jgi:ATP-dependent Lon protease